MSKILQAASVAAVLMTLASTIFIADSTIASSYEANTQLASDQIIIDPDKVADPRDETVAAREIAEEQQIIQQVQQLPVPDGDASVEQQPALRTEDPVRPGMSLAQLVAAQNVDAPLDSEQHCLAGAVYFESKGETLAGQLAVAKVILSRATSGRFPKTICGVVFQPSQFSFVRGGKMPAIPVGSAAWRSAKAIALIAQQDQWESPVEGALFFHARRVSPGWRLTRLGMIDNHIFYR